MKELPAKRILVSISLFVLAVALFTGPTVTVLMSNGVLGTHLKTGFPANTNNERETTDNEPSDPLQPVTSGNSAGSGISESEKSEPSDVQTQAGTIAVSGSFVFQEEDGVTERNVRYATVQLCDSDLGGALISVLAETQTQTDGSYIFPPIVNDDGWLEDGFDIFVRIYTDSFIVKVTDNSWPSYSVYEDQTPQLDNVADGSINMGKKVITNDRGAWAIYDTLILGWQYATTFPHFQPKVTVRWPAGSTGIPMLTPYVVNLVAGDEWDEDVILHEYGHSVQYDVFGEWIPESGGDHTWNQHTNPNFAFSEGWPTFLGVAGAKEKGYGDSLFPQDSHYEDTIDQWIDTDLETDSHEPGDDVEGAIACLLWDIYDNTDDGRDVLTAGISPIWDVFENYITDSHNVYTIHEFWDGWMDRGHGNTQQLWGIYYDHGIDKDSDAPSNPSFFSSSHTLGAWSSDATIDISWGGASDDVSGIYGYSYVWVQTPTLPDTSVDSTGTSDTSPSLADSEWYFCIRTRDNSGRWSIGYSQYGPFWIDSTNPTFSTQSPIGGTKYDNDQTTIRLQLDWSDSQSGISTVRFRYRYDTYTWSSWLGPSGSSGNTNWYDISSSDWTIYVGSTLFWESYAVNGASSTEFTSTFTGPNLRDDDNTPPSLYNPVSPGDVLDSHPDDLLIQISASDSSGIYSVHFAYRFGSGAWSDWQPSTGSSGDDYWYHLSRTEWISQVGETLYWEAYAWDNDIDRLDDSSGASSPVYTSGTISDDDNTGPSFSNPTSNFVKVPRAFRIQADVTDSSDIYSVQFRYKFAVDPWSDWYDSTGVSGNTYWFDINWDWSAFDLETMDWQVYAEDYDNDGWTGDRASSQSSQYSDVLPPFNVVFYVPTEYSTIQATIDVACGGDTIYVYAGTYYENVIVDKSIMITGEDVATTIVHNVATDGPIIWIIADNVTIENLTLAGVGTPEPGNTPRGVRIESNFNVIRENKMENLWDAIIILHANNNSIIGNKMTENQWGIWASSTNSTIEQNQIWDNSYGIHLGGSNYMVRFNNISYNSYGLYLMTVEDSTFERNYIAHNNKGLFAYDTFHNNVLFHNDFMYNTEQIELEGYLTNSWDNSYPAGGNYWSDHTNTDEFRGLLQNEFGSDGISDLPYIVNSNNADNYPLMKPYAGPCDIGLSQITSSKSIVSQGYSVTIDIKVTNYGMNFETFDIAVYADTTLIQIITDVSVTSRNSSIITFIWITADISYGYYILTATADTLPSETDTSDNTLSNGFVMVTVSGDVNGDRTVDIFDIGYISAHWYPGPPVGLQGYSSNADVNSDGAVDIFDVGIASSKWGQYFPTRSWTVDDDGPADFHTIQEALNVADPGDSVFVRTGTYYECLMIRKAVSLIGEDRYTTIIDGNLEGTVLNITVSNVNIINFTIRGSRLEGSYCAISVHHSAGNNISHNILLNNYAGIHVFWSSDNLLRNNTIFDNEIGIILDYSHHNLLEENILFSNDFYNFMVAGNESYYYHNYVDTSNTVDGKPIYYLMGIADTVIDAQTNGGNVWLIDCHNITVKDLVLTGNSFGIFLWNTTNSNIENVNASINIVGIYLCYSNGNNLRGNSIYGNFYGLGLSHSYNNAMSNNTFSSNSGIGVFFANSSNNMIFHNNFINNTLQIYDSSPGSPSTNTWDNGYPSGGNYWSDYTGIDDNSGPNQNETGSDGIGDTPYVIDANNIDGYPLMNQYG